MSDPRFIKTTAQEFCERVFSALQLTGDISVTEDDGAWWVKLEVDDPRLLIGHSGEHIAILEHLARRVLGRALGNEEREAVRIIFDVNRYRKHRIEALRETARQIADSVRFSQKPFAFEPMPAFERRVIHTVLSERLDVSTESTGEGTERRVMVKPAT